MSIPVLCRPDIIYLIFHENHGYGICSRQLRPILTETGKPSSMSTPFADLIRTRQSVREYQPRPVADENLQRLIEAVRLAPSASNSQPWRLIIVNDPELKDRVARAAYSPLITFNRFALQAPVIAVLTIERPGLVTRIGARLKNREFPLIDIGIAAEHFCLQARARPRDVLDRRLLRGQGQGDPRGSGGYPRRCAPSLGYPAEDPAPDRENP